MSDDAFRFCHERGFPLSVLLGHRGSIQENIYREVDAALAAEENGGGANYCSINFMTVEYDTRNGSTVYSSLQNGILLVYIIYDNY